MTGAPGRDARVRVLRIIARMNVGGPAHHVSILSGRLDPGTYRSLLVAGHVGPGEGSAAGLAERHGAEVLELSSLGPTIRPLADLRALVGLVRIMRRFRPDIVHTHTAKAGLLGRLAALVARPRPVVVHTYHGHVLSGYFGRFPTLFFRFLERLLGPSTDALVAVSSATVDELVGFRVAPRDRFRVVPIGLDLDPFLEVAGSEPGGEELRSSLGVRPDEVLGVFVGRLVPIKRLDVLLRAVARARADGAPLRLAIVGDGEVADGVRALTESLGLEGAVAFLGFRTDLASIAAASDIAVLSSDNEGTPVALIEAAAAALPSVATSVGGVPDIVDERTGRLVPPGETEPFAEALRELAGDADLRRRLGAAARENVRQRYSAQRLLDDVDALYQELLRARKPGGRSRR